MKKQFEKLQIFIFIFFFIFILLRWNLPGLLALDYSGVPRETSFYYGFTIMGEPVSAKLVSTYTIPVLELKEFSAFLEKLSEKLGYPLSKESFKVILSIAEVHSGFLTGQKGLETLPAFFLVIRFKNEKALEEFTGKAEEFLKKNSGTSILFQKKDIENITVTTLDTSKSSGRIWKSLSELEINYFKNSSSLHILLSPARNKELSNILLEASLASLKTPEHSILGNTSFKKFLSRLNSPAAILFIDGAINGKSAKESKFAGLFEYAGLGTAFRTDEIMSTDFFLVFKEEAVKNKNFWIIKNLLSSIPPSIDGTRITPAGSIFHLALRFNLGPQIKEIEGYDRLRNGLKFLAINLDELISWLGGELLLGLNDYTVPPAEQVRLGELLAPEFFFAIHTKNPEKTFEFIETRILPLLSARDPEVVFRKDSETGALLAPVKKSPFKDMALTVGPVGEYIVFATTRETFAKCQRAHNGTLKTIASGPSFISTIPSTGGFLLMYWDTGRTGQIIEDVSQFVSRFENLSPGWHKTIGFNGVFEGYEIELKGAIIMDWTKMSEYYRKKLNQLIERKFLR